MDRPIPVCVAPINPPECEDFELLAEDDPDFEALEEKKDEILLPQVPFIESVIKEDESEDNVASKLIALLADHRKKLEEV